MLVLSSLDNLLYDAHIMFQKGVDAVCQMNKTFNQTAGQVAHKSYPSCAVRAKRHYHGGL